MKPITTVPRALSTIGTRTLEKLGGDSIAETRRNTESYLKALQERW